MSEEIHTHTPSSPSVCVGTGWRGSYGQTLVVMTKSVLQAKIKQTYRNCFSPFFAEAKLIFRAHKGMALKAILEENG